MVGIPLPTCGTENDLPVDAPTPACDGRTRRANEPAVLCFDGRQGSSGGGNRTTCPERDRRKTGTSSLWNLNRGFTEISRIVVGTIAFSLSELRRKNH